ncbi:hypothetical protein EON63_14130 [archaeon]|nr:MAG: hypothetical protein EON63_14130 [archaeon]
MLCCRTMDPLASVLPAQGRILCCLCGVSIIPNAAAMCIPCLQKQADITEGIPREAELIMCKKCDRYQVQNDHWVHHDLESTGLLSLCLKRIPALSAASVKITHATWIWTEPHSKRLKVLVELEKGLMDDKVAITQSIPISYTIKNKQCMDCIRENTDHTWGCLLQLRQYGMGRKTPFAALETQLIKANIHSLMQEVSVVKEGMDIYFKQKNQAEKVLGRCVWNVFGMRLSVYECV